ncbi:MAG: LysR family transcriptional regulator, partial [Lachnospiraceae bacterium]|nr:LysR family transcriptional regulator [Lachnospiraceae bacterium]
MNLDQMHFFTVVAQMENVSKAADSLHMTQSTLSKNILRLEEELGVPLFDRHGKKLF